MSHWRKQARVSITLIVAQIALGSICVATPALAQNLVRERATTLTVPAGREVRAGHFENTGGRGCPNPAGVPQIIVTQQPANGTVSVREGDAPFGQVLLGGGDPGCGDRPIHGIHIYYTSRAGFMGVDGFVYRVVFPRGALVTTTHVDVR